MSTQSKYDSALQHLQFFKGLIDKECKINECKDIIFNLQIHIDKSKYSVSESEFRDLIKEGLSWLIADLNQEADGH